MLKTNDRLATDLDAVYFDYPNDSRRHLYHQMALLVQNAFLAAGKGTDTLVANRDDGTTVDDIINSLLAYAADDKFTDDHTAANDYLVDVNDTLAALRQ